MPAYRSPTTTHGRTMAGVPQSNFAKLIIELSNSLPQFVPH